MYQPGFEPATSRLLSEYAIHYTTAAEVDDVVGPSRMPRFWYREAMPYTIATVFEVFLDTPLAPDFCQCHIKPLMTKTSKEISSILPNHWFIHHDPQLWNKPWCSIQNTFWTVGVASSTRPSGTSQSTRVFHRSQGMSRRKFREIESILVFGNDPSIVWYYSRF